MQGAPVGPRPVPPGEDEVIGSGAALDPLRREPRQEVVRDRDDALGRSRVGFPPPAFAPRPLEGDDADGFRVRVYVADERMAFTSSSRKYLGRGAEVALTRAVTCLTSDTGCASRVATLSANVADLGAVGQKLGPFPHTGSSGFFRLRSAPDGAFCRGAAHLEMQQNLHFVASLPCLPHLPWQC